jgi:hypothetical protein
MARLQQKAGGSHHRFSQINRRSLRDGFNGFLRALPGDRAFLPPSSADRSAHLAPASGRQNHATSPSASTPLGAQQMRPALSVHCYPAPNDRDDRKPPLLLARNERILDLIWVSGEAKYFRYDGWTCFLRMRGGSPDERSTR